MDSRVQRLYQLAWKPGSVMHHGWWDYLSLTAWQPYYCHTRALGYYIDGLICQQRHYPHAPLPVTLSQKQQQLLDWESRLVILFTALGIYLLQCPDYLLRGEYRQRLATVLGWPALSQLWALWPGGDRAPLLDPETVQSQAYAYGYLAWTYQQQEDPVWLALQMTQEPQPTVSAQLPAFPKRDLWPDLYRLARFL